MMSPKNRIRFEKIACARAGDPDTTSATAAVIPSPTNIQP